MQSEKRKQSKARFYGWTEKDEVDLKMRGKAPQMC